MRSAAEIKRVLGKLERQHPNADTELNYTNPYELLVATILSAQTTDERVNSVTPALFKRYGDAFVLARAVPEDVESLIKPTGFFRAKTRSLLGMAGRLVDHHAGQVPTTMDELVELPGVGRKTANVVLGHALGVPGLPVDRHVLRVANRIGLVDTLLPELVEKRLCAVLPAEQWTRASDTLILHGRRICTPKPKCERCFVRDQCDFYRSAPRGVSRLRPADRSSSGAAKGDRPVAKRARG